MCHAGQRLTYLSVYRAQHTVGPQHTVTMVVSGPWCSLILRCSRSWGGGSAGDSDRLPGSLRVWSEEDAVLGAAPQGPRTDPAALGGLGQPAALWGDPGGADAGCQARGAACGGVCPCPGHRALVDPTWIPPSSSGKPSGHPSRRASAGRDPLSSSGTTGSWGFKGLAEESRMLGVNLIHARRHQALVGS